MSSASTKNYRHHLRLVPCIAPALQASRGYFILVTISGILGIPLLSLTGCEIRFVFWLLRASGRVEPYIEYLGQLLVA
jgi:hypothetical protein